MNPAEERFSARFLKRCRCVRCDQQLVDRVGVFRLVDQQMSRSTRVNFPVARGGYVVVYSWYLESRILSDVVWISCCDAVSFSWNAAFWNFACDQQQESLLFVDSNQQMVERQVDEYVSDDELDADNHEGEEHVFMAIESGLKDPVACPSNQHALNVERNLVPPISLQPFCVLNKAQSSLESRHSQHSNQLEQEMDDNYQENLNTLPAIEMAPNIISKTIIEPLEDEGEEDNPEATSSEDKTLEDAPKQILQRSLSAGNLKLKGSAITHRMTTRSHTRSQGTSSSQSFQ
ncbi:endoribonuclease Dicer1 [Dorcoceras hygrometricum]|uniref:Endoribonuclease Dicer1 n=1 Tax=Dorcoceras hygrometricum TaxID=472368 RepID=A0A2Z7CF55_9LAMI|nr:endoribonuclease Dicer1 [Dorcoceras hygrometricum]